MAHAVTHYFEPQGGQPPRTNHFGIGQPQGQGNTGFANMFTGAVSAPGGLGSGQSNTNGNIFANKAQPPPFGATNQYASSWQQMKEQVPFVWGQQQLQQQPPSSSNPFQNTMSQLGLSNYQVNPTAPTLWKEIPLKALPHKDPKAMWSKDR
jgi:hypothetical protein